MWSAGSVVCLQRQESPLKARTRQDYYKRIRQVYRWARENVVGAEDLPELPYESFAPRGRTLKKLLSSDNLI